jgi:hypothetical protein
MSSSVNQRIAELKPNQQRGSKPRCHLMTHGSRPKVAARLSSLIAPFGTIQQSDCWLPDGFDNMDEAQLGKCEQLIASDDIRSALIDWWLEVPRNANTPNWDIASTCTIGGERGIVLVEAKAHDKELLNECRPKPLSASASQNSRRNHECIGIAITEASDSLSAATGLTWKLSRDKCYQMSNRFAWAWKLTERGIPVVLVYLGFLCANDMQSGTQLPLASADEWERIVKSQSAAIFPAVVWNRQWNVNDKAFCPLIRSLGCSLAGYP